MQQKLIIQLHADKCPSWVLVESAGVYQVKIQGDPAELGALANERSVIVLVPSEDVLLTTAMLPKMNRSRLMQAVPYAVEEQIIEDVESMHFAVSEQRANEPVTVAVVDREKMKAWQALFATWQINPDVVLPAVFALPGDTSAWYVQIDDIAMVRTGLVSGFACDSDNLNELLSLAIAAASTPPEKIVVYHSQTEIPPLSINVALQTEQRESAQLLIMMAEQLGKEAPLNLLQGVFQNKKVKRLPKVASVYRLAAYLLVLWVGLLFLYPIVSYAILNQREADIKKQIALIYKRHFPNASGIVAPKERMQQKINKSSADVGDNRLLMLIAKVGVGLSNSSGLQLKRLDFQNNAMTLEVSATSSDVFSAFTDSLSQQGLRVKQQNANLNGARVSATLQVE